MELLCEKSVYFRGDYLVQKGSCKEEIDQTSAISGEKNIPRQNQIALYRQVRGVAN